MTASGNESDEGDLVTVRGHDDLLGEQGIAHAVDAIGSGHVESGLGETGIDPRIVTRLCESERDATGSGPKTATTRWRAANETRPASDALDREQ